VNAGLFPAGLVNDSDDAAAAPAPQMEIFDAVAMMMTPSPTPKGLAASYKSLHEQQQKRWYPKTQNLSAGDDVTSNDSKELVAVKVAVNHSVESLLGQIASCTLFEQMVC
jgi:hypothetical protein